MKRAVVTVLCVFLVPRGPAAAQVPSRGVEGRAGVYSRTITAVIGDGKGNAPATPPAPADLELLEDGRPVTVTGIERLVPPSAAAPAPTSRMPEEHVAARPLAQLLFLDVALLRRASVREISAGFRRSLGAVLANGPLQIVVADPEPRVFLAPTGERAVVDAALARLGAEVVGGDRLSRHRKEYVEAVDLRKRPFLPKERTAETLAYSPEPTVADGAARGTEGPAVRGLESLVRSYALEEVQLLGDGLRRLRDYAESIVGPAPRVLYLGSDGFDMNPVAFYNRGVPTRDTISIGPQVAALVAETTEALGRAGWIVVPVAPGAAVGTPSSEVTAEASGPAHSSFFASGAPGDFLLTRPTDGLRQIAEPTGGDLVLDLDEVGAALPGLTRTFLIAYSVDRAPDGRTHRIELRSRRPGLVVTASRSVAAGTPEVGAAQRGVAFLAGGDAGELPVTVAVGPAQPSGPGRQQSELTIKVRLASVRKVLERVGSGSLRFSLVVEVPGFEPVSHHEEVALPESIPDVFSLKVPLGRPDAATRVAVVAEDLAAGLWGAGAASLRPTPDVR